MRKIDAADYDWEEMGDMSPLQLVIRMAKMGTLDQVEEAELVGEPEGGQWGRFGRRLQDAAAAALFPDGTGIALVTVSQWAGTFASHDDIITSYWKLRPKKKRGTKK